MSRWRHRFVIPPVSGLGVQEVTAVNARRWPGRLACVPGSAGSDARAVASPAPVQVAGLGSVTQVSAGCQFSLAICRAGFIQLPGAAKEGAT